MHISNASTRLELFYFYIKWNAWKKKNKVKVKITTVYKDADEQLRVQDKHRNVTTESPPNPRFHSPELLSDAKHKHVC